MKAPSLTDRVVKVRAHLTDETFGYEHWRAMQFSSPEISRPAVLVMFDTELERERFFQHVKDAIDRGRLLEDG